MEGIHKKRFQTKAFIAGLKTVLMAFNVVFWATGLILLIIGLWMKMSLSKFFELSQDTRLSLPVVFAVLGITIIVVGFFACSCTAKGNPRLLFTYTGVLLVLFVVIFCASMVGYAHRSNLQQSFRDGFNSSVFNYGDNTLTDRDIDRIQGLLQCCGAHGYTDYFRTEWANHTDSVPRSCCIDMKSCQNWQISDDRQINLNGCVDKVINILRDNFKTIGLGALFIALFQLIGIILSFSLAKYINNALYEQMT